jgi:hypothetical protein
MTQIATRVDLSRLNCLVLLQASQGRMIGRSDGDMGSGAPRHEAAPWTTI